MVTLETSNLFGCLAPAEVRVLQEAAREEKFIAGQEIFKEGDSGDGVYLVREGRVEISGLVGPEGRRVFSQTAPGDIFGEMAVLENKPRSATAVAVEDTTVYFVPREVVLQLVRRSPSLALNLLQEMSHRLREFNRQYIREVLQAERLALVGRFARTIVHDLKNPLNIIGLAAELAGGKDASVETRHAAQVRIRTQVERISDLVNQILEFTQGPQTELVLTPTDYAAFVRQLVEEIRPEIKLKAVRLELENEPPAVRVLLNPKRLQRVFYNLIHNATDAMPTGGKVTLRFRPDQTEIVTEIEDTGPGFAPEIAPHLFEAFATHGKAHGTGLGLSICKRIVEDHRGRISARNEPGRGAVFLFTLPLAT